MASAAGALAALSEERRISRPRRPPPDRGRAFWRCSTKPICRATILASVPWFLQDLGTYGIGIFTPTILAASIGHKTAHVRSLADLISNDELAAKGAALIDLLLIVGIVCRHPSRKQNRQHPAAGMGLYRLRRWPAHRRCL